MDSRNEDRKKTGAKAWIRLEGGFSVRPCVVEDLSRSGVQLMVDAPSIIPDRFVLSLSRNATQDYACVVKWRRGKRIGAAFRKS